MTFKEYLYQWWMLQSVTDRAGNPKKEKATVYHEQLFCNHLQIEYFEDKEDGLSFEVYFVVEFIDDGEKFIACDNWRTSPIVEINEIENSLQVITKNSIYTFEKVNESVFKWFEKIKLYNKVI